MWEIIGLLFLLLIIIIAIAFAGDALCDFDGFYSKESSGNRRKNQKRNYEDEKAKSVYTAAGKSLKLNMIQMDAFRQMSNAAQKHYNQNNDEQG